MTIQPNTPEDPMNMYTPIHTHAQLVEALRRGLTVEINTKDNESAADYQAPQGGWVAGLPAVTIAADDPNSYAWQWFAFRAVGEHDLSAPAKPEPKPLTNADFNPGDIVRHRGKKWRVQGIDDGDPGCGLLLLDVAEPKDAPDFVGTGLPVTRGSNRRPDDRLGEYRWCWGSAENVELVSRGEPEAGPAEPDQWQQDMLRAIARGDRQRLQAMADGSGTVEFQPGTHPCAALYHATQPGGAE